MRHSIFVCHKITIHISIYVYTIQPLKVFISAETEKGLFMEVSYYNIIIVWYFSLSRILEQPCGFNERAPFSLTIFFLRVCMYTEDLQSKGIPQTTKSYKITQHAHSNRNRINVAIGEE